MSPIEAPPDSKARSLPTNSAPELVALESPVSTLESFVVFVASSEAAPAETTPSTCPPTPSPVVEVAVCDPVSRLFPFCTFPQSDEHEVLMSATSRLVERFSPTNAAKSLDDFASPVVMSELVDVFAATMLAEPPADVTAPMTCPATPSPVAALADWLSVVVLFPSCTLPHPSGALHELVTSAGETVRVPKLAFSPVK